MGDAVDVTSDNSLVHCFDFVFVRKEWKLFSRALRVYFRKFCRSLRVMDDYSDDIVNRRVGHIAVRYGQDSILVWGGYTTHKTSPHEYWPTNQICVFNRLRRTWRVVKTFGHVPPLTSGATGQIHENKLYVFFGFCHFPKGLIDQNVLEDLSPLQLEILREHFVESNSNNAYFLDLETLLWTKLHPTGPTPLKVDKVSSWLHREKIYLFGGFGPAPPEVGAYPPELMYHNDPEVMQIHPRGWTNQLIVYNTVEDSWAWPLTKGDIPSPRAAHACVCNSNGDAFLFGGRNGDQRLNDLYHLDLSRLCWTRLSANVEKSLMNQQLPMPIGRSWHTLSLVDDYKAVLYGGYDQDCQPLGDCWSVNLDLRLKPSENRWTRLPFLDKGPLLWHCSVAMPTGEIYALGGVTNDLIHLPMFHVKHPRQITSLLMAPPQLLTLALDTAVKHYRAIKEASNNLPPVLKSYLDDRRKKYIHDRDRSASV